MFSKPVSFCCELDSERRTVTTPGSKRAGWDKLNFLSGFYSRPARTISISHPDKPSSRPGGVRRNIGDIAEKGHPKTGAASNCFSLHVVNLLTTSCSSFAARTSPRQRDHRTGGVLMAARAGSSVHSAPASRPRQRRARPGQQRADLVEIEGEA